MPRKPKRPCSYPSCPRLTDGRFCEEHAKQEARRYEKYDRLPEVKKRYGRAWQVIRNRFIAAHPLCEICEKNGKITPAEEVHHIKPRRLNGSNTLSNLITLCSKCHQKTEGKEEQYMQHYYDILDSSDNKNLNYASHVMIGKNWLREQL